MHTRTVQTFEFEKLQVLGGIRIMASFQGRGQEPRHNIWARKDYKYTPQLGHSTLTSKYQLFSCIPSLASH